MPEMESLTVSTKTLPGRPTDGRPTLVQYSDTFYLNYADNSVSDVPCESPHHIVCPYYKLVQSQDWIGGEMGG